MRLRQLVAVTGGSGFIGSAFIHGLKDTPVLNLDKGTYAADPRRLEGFTSQTIDLDITSPALVDLVVDKKPSVVVHFAAETHVTRSETAPDLFHRTNVEGTRNVLEASEKAGVGLVVHVSTDEVYGPTTDVPFKEGDKQPGEGSATSPYARSKALADDLALEPKWRVPVIVVRPTNCFGPWQHPEKAIPRWTIRALRDEPIPVWGDGEYVRDWMFVDDACSAIERVIDEGRPGEVYNIGPENDVRTNLEIARSIARYAGRSPDSVYLTAYDRPAHDRRYSVDASTLRSLRWGPTASLDQRLEETVAWYRANEWWWAPLLPQAEALYEDVLPRHPA